MPVCKLTNHRETAAYDHSREENCPNTSELAVWHMGQYSAEKAVFYMYVA